MKQFVLSIVAALVLVTSVKAQEVEPPVVSISAQQSVFTPNQVTLRRGETVTLRVTSTDRIHHLYSKELGFNVDLRPSQPYDITLNPMKAGRFVAISDGRQGAGQLIINVE
jgi:cytochrome c oxidase subunit 2